MLSQADGNHPELRAVLEHLLSSGGKRVRPTVVLLTGGMLNADSDRLVTLSAAIELLHTATLVHDDLIDGSLLRRGMPTINANWTPAATVLAGDFIFSRAAKLAAETSSVRVMQLFAETLSMIVDGEITQLFSKQRPVSREDYYRRIYSKTASLFELATRAAAMLSLAGDEVMEKVCQYGYEVGMAFQIVDDILDFTGEQVTVGKPVGSDLHMGIITLPVFQYIEKCPNDDRVQAILSGYSLRDDELTSLVESIRSSDAIKDSLEEARQFASRGIDALTDLPLNEERQELEELARYIVCRDL